MEKETIFQKVQKMQSATFRRNDGLTAEITEIRWDSSEPIGLQWRCSLQSPYPGGKKSNFPLVSAIMYLDIRDYKLVE